MHAHVHGQRILVLSLGELKGSEAENQLFWRFVVVFTHRRIFVTPTWWLHTHTSHTQAHTRTHFPFEWFLPMDRIRELGRRTELSFFKEEIESEWKTRLCVRVSWRRPVMRPEPCDSHLNWLCMPVCRQKKSIQSYSALLQNSITYCWDKYRAYSKFLSFSNLKLDLPSDPTLFPKPLPSYSSYLFFLHLTRTTLFEGTELCNFQGLCSLG